MAKKIRLKMSYECRYYQDLHFVENIKHNLRECPQEQVEIWTTNIIRLSSDVKFFGVGWKPPKESTRSAYKNKKFEKNRFEDVNIPGNRH
uniref:Uncharacterized protein n=1 Tax=Megaselia scalaris TaxID=36166 RepID=T1GP30_MEGSC